MLFEVEVVTDFEVGLMFEVELGVGIEFDAGVEVVGIEAVAEFFGLPDFDIDFED